MMQWIPLDAPAHLSNSIPGKKVKGFLASVLLYNWAHHEQDDREDFTLDALEVICKKLSELSQVKEESVHYLVVVDLDGINSRIESRSVKVTDEFRKLWKKIQKILDANRASLAFTSCSINVLEQVFDSSGLSRRCESSDNDFICYGLLTQWLTSIDSCSAANYGTERLATPSITNFLRGRLVEKIQKFDGWEPLRSTPVDATGFLNAGFLIGDPEVFPWLILELSKRLRLFKTENDDPVTLVALSRNGTVLARAISRFLSDYSVNVIDHLAPAAHAVESYHHPAPPEYPARQRFLFVGDVLIAGTEYRMCQAYATICNADFDGAVFICAIFESVRSLLKPRGDEDRPQKIEALFDLLDLDRQLDFRFPIQNFSNSGSDKVEGFTFDTKTLNILTIAWDGTDLAKVFKDIDDVQTSAEKSGGWLRTTHVMPPKFAEIQKYLSLDTANKRPLTSFHVIYVAAHGDSNSLWIDYEKEYGCSQAGFKKLIEDYVDLQDELIAAEFLKEPKLKVLFLNACNTAFLGESLKDKVHCVISMDGLVDATRANLFCSGFFDALRTTSNTFWALRQAFTRASTVEKGLFKPKAWIDKTLVKLK
jgi:hypothetical protein